MKHLLKLQDLNKSEILDLLNLADQLKYETKHGIEHHLLKGKTLGMIFQKSSEVPYETTGGLESVAVRMPNHPVALALIQAGLI